MSNPPKWCPTSSGPRPIRRVLLGAAILCAGLAQAAQDPGFESAEAVNEGALHFLETLPPTPLPKPTTKYA